MHDMTAMSNEERRVVGEALIKINLLAHATGLLAGAASILVHENDPEAIYGIEQLFAKLKEVLKEAKEIEEAL